MDRELLYSKKVGICHLKQYGQYFTPPLIAEFMSKWVAEGATSVLDPAVGNSIFFKNVRKYNANCTLTGYEIDRNILDFFGNPTCATIFNRDYFDDIEEQKFDAIIANPPYNKFQNIENRKEIIKKIQKITGIKCSGYTNLYILFLLKSIYQLSDRGRLAYIIPSEFLNSTYGNFIKKELLEKKLIKAIINISDDTELYFNATTTCCILLLDKTPKKYIEFYNLPCIQDITKDDNEFLKIEYSQIKTEKK